MSPGTRSGDPKTYILDFFYDDDDGSALTARINDHRFHIVVNPSKLRETGGIANNVLKEYQKKVHGLRQVSAQSPRQTERNENHGPAKHDPEEGFVRCVCCARRDNEGLMMVACEECGVWQHNVCMGFTRDEEKLDTARYYCEQCRPKRHTRLLSAKRRRRKPWEARKKQALRGYAVDEGDQNSMVDGANSEHDHDSAVDVGLQDQSSRQGHAAGTTASHDSGVDLSMDRSDLELDLQNWIMSCLGDEVQQVAPPQVDQPKPTLFDWYNTPIHFYELEVHDGALAPVEIVATKQSERRLDKLVPYIDIPDYIHSLDIPVLEPTTMNVIETSEAIEPVHPSLVRHDGEEYFFKPVDPAEPAPTKREISLLHKIHDLGLDKQMKVPKIRYLVAQTSHLKSSIMGFLMTGIASPTPLTKLMDSDVSESKRHRWAKESERMVSTLHEHGIVWGDAKGDNFLVDKADDLWIIDFGGSYTEGWVEPELVETEEGDDAGLERIINALDDPDGNTFDPEEEVVAKERGKGDTKRGTTCEHGEPEWERGAVSKKARS